jgi:hypothetical protein
MPPLYIGVEDVLRHCPEHRKGEVRLVDREVDTMAI